MNSNDIALYTVFLLILRLNIVVSSQFLITQIVVIIKMTIVVVFIPPPVPQGEAPMNIKKLVNSFVNVVV